MGTTAHGELPKDGAPMDRVPDQCCNLQEGVDPRRSRA